MILVVDRWSMIDDDVDALCGVDPLILCYFFKLFSIGTMKAQQLEYTIGRNDDRLVIWRIQQQTQPTRAPQRRPPPLRTHRRTTKLLSMMMMMMMMAHFIMVILVGTISTAVDATNIIRPVDEKTIVSDVHQYPNAFKVTNAVFYFAVVRFLDKAKILFISDMLSMLLLGCNISFPIQDHETAYRPKFVSIAVALHVPERRERHRITSVLYVGKCQWCQLLDEKFESTYTTGEYKNTSDFAKCVSVGDVMSNYTMALKQLSLLFRLSSIVVPVGHMVP